MSRTASRPPSMTNQLPISTELVVGPGEVSDEDVHSAVMWFFQGTHLMEDDIVAHELVRVALCKFLEKLSVRTSVAAPGAGGRDV